MEEAEDVAALGQDLAVGGSGPPCSAPASGYDRVTLAEEGPG